MTPPPAPTASVVGPGAFHFCLQYLPSLCCPLSHFNLQGTANIINIGYSLIQMKCQGGNKYVLSITVKFDQSTRRFGRISFARLFKWTKHSALLFYLLSPYLLLCMRGSINVRKNIHIIKTIMKFCAHCSTVCGMTRDSNSVSQLCAALQRPIISKCQHSTKFGNTVYVKFSLIFAILCWLAR